MYAVEGGNPNIINLFLNQVGKKNEDNFSAIMIATDNKNVEAFNILKSTKSNLKYA